MRFDVTFFYRSNDETREDHFTINVDAYYGAPLHKEHGIYNTQHYAALKLAVALTYDRSDEHLPYHFAIVKSENCVTLHAGDNVIADATLDSPDSPDVAAVLALAKMFAEAVHD